MWGKTTELYGKYTEFQICCNLLLGRKWKWHTFICYLILFVQIPHAWTWCSQFLPPFFFAFCLFRQILLHLHHLSFLSLTYLLWSEGNPLCMHTRPLSMHDNHLHASLLALYSWESVENKEWILWNDCTQESTTNTSIKWKSLPDV